MMFQIEKKGIEMRVNIDQNVPVMINSDQKRIKQILFNLIGNALKFTYKGKITLGLEYDALSGILSVSVQDTGIGIKPEDLAKLFQFFSQVSSSKNINKSGMGLGLTISKMIIQQLGGEIEVKSEPGVGSTFFFSIPLSYHLEE